MWYLKKNQKGQSAVEFVLIVPLLFFIFFAIIQMAYMSYVSLAVQRAALAIARTASIGGKNNSAAFKIQLVISLLPIANLNPQILFTILSSSYKITTSSDQTHIMAQVSYPMPIWVPLVGNVFGDQLQSSVNYNDTPDGQAVKTELQLLNLNPPDLSFQGVRLPVHWITYEATTFNEAYGHWI
jgi:Flp pilus assembly protein TadG